LDSWQKHNLLSGLDSNYHAIYSTPRTLCRILDPLPKSSYQFFYVFTCHQSYWHWDSNIWSRFSLVVPLIYLWKKVILKFCQNDQSTRIFACLSFLVVVQYYHSSKLIKLITFDIIISGYENMLILSIS
jgi:hypothetical protein